MVDAAEHNSGKDRLVRNCCWSIESTCKWSIWRSLLCRTRFLQPAIDQAQRVSGARATNIWQICCCATSLNWKETCSST
ncbi:hypothetical protein pipiens_005330 [Culex pipiens pipiens]|uniref:Uncharacterized protein n=1 Tax=Culex pipiens pipiens TaxID=38569 RepID=A0ABD1DXL5_CULPP